MNEEVKNDVRSTLLSYVRKELEAADEAVEYARRRWDEFEEAMRKIDEPMMDAYKYLRTLQVKEPLKSEPAEFDVGADGLEEAGRALKEMEGKLKEVETQGEGEE